METEECADWDIEQYRHPWDCDEHWEIRKEFILTYKDRFPEDKLICLAQVYANIELLGCRYPTEVTKQVNYLAADLENRVNKKKDQIKFVKSSDSVGQGDEPPTKKSKLVKKEQHSTRAVTNEKSTVNGRESFGFSTTSINRNPSQNEVNYSPDDNVPSYFTSNYRNQAQLSSEDHQASNVKIGRKDSSKKPKLPKRKNKDNKASNSSYLNRENVGNINLPQATLNILKNELKFCPANSDNGDILTFINNCATKAHLLINYDYLKYSVNPLIFSCTLQLNHFSVGEGKGCTKKFARIAACKTFVKNLSSMPHTSSRDMNDKTNIKTNLKKKRKNAAVNLSSFKKQNSTMKPTGNPCKFIIIEQDCFNVNNPLSTLSNSANFNKKQLKFQFEEDFCTINPVRCHVYLDDKMIASANEMSKQKAKYEASQKALEHLKTFCPTIKQKTKVVSDSEVSKTSFQQAAKIAKEYEAIPETNIGNKLMRLMGWSGGGLGKGEDGIEEPIRIQTVIGRNGLGSVRGSSDRKQFRKMVTEKLLEYINSSSSNDMVFDSEFTKEERKEIHQIAQRYNLKSVSRGKGDQRSLTVSRKWTPLRLFDHVKNAGGSTDKYELIPPAKL